MTVPPRPPIVPTSTTPRAVVAFLTAGGLVLVAALERGAYDQVTRQQGAFLVWLLLAAALLVGVVPRTRPGLPGLLVLAALAALAGWTAISLTWTASDERTYAELARVLGYLGVVLVGAIALGPGSWRPAIAGAATAAGVVCLVALLGRLDPGTFGADDAADAFGINRLSRPIGYWNALGAWAGMTSALGLALGAHARAPAARALATAMIPLAMSVAYLTYSRASIGGTALGVLVVFAVSRNRWTVAVHAGAALAAGLGAVLLIHGTPEIAEATGTAGAGRVALAVLAACAVSGAVAVATGLTRVDGLRMPRRTGRITAAVVALVAVLAVGAAAAAGGESAWEDFKTAQAADDPDPAARLANLRGTRYAIWTTALDRFEADPWQGDGAGTFEFAWSREGTGGEFIKDAHSLYLEALAELGVVGLALLLAMVGAIAWAAIAVLRRFGDGPERGAAAAAAGAIAAYLFGAGLDWLWEATAVSVLALVLVGALLAAGGREVDRPSAAWRVPAGLVAVVIALVQLPGIVSLSEVRESRAAAEAGDLAAAKEHATTAIEAQPWAATPYAQRALVFEEAGRFPAAAADLHRAVEREPENWRHHLLLARVEAERRNNVEALAAFTEAFRLRPSSPFFVPQE